MQYINSRQRGYTLLFAVLTAVLALGIGVFILGVARKQYIITSTAKDSLLALYMADSAIECIVQAKIYDLDTFPDDDGLTLSDAQMRTLIPCFGLSAQPTIYTAAMPESKPEILGLSASQSPASDKDFYLYYKDVDKTCAIVKIFRAKVNNNTTTVVNARGYNQCTSAGPSTSLRTVERAMQFTVQ